VAVKSALTAVFTKLDWLNNTAPVAFPGVELLPGGCVLVFDFVDDEHVFGMFVTNLVYELEQGGWSGALLPPPGTAADRHTPQEGSLSDRRAGLGR
jgi:hypothetical protein